MKENNQKNGDTNTVVLATPTTDVLNLDLSNNYEESLAVLTNIVASKKFKDIPTVNDAVAYYVKSKELGLPFISSLDHMFMIGGKTNIDVHLMRALVLKAGCVYWEEVHNYQPLYKYIDRTGYVVAIDFDDSCLPFGYTLVDEPNVEAIEAKMVELESIGKVPVFKQVDMVTYAYDPVPGSKETIPRSHINYGTKYKFERNIPFTTSTSKIITEYGVFTFRDAVNAGLLAKKNGEVNLDSNWLKYMRNMLEHRSWTFGCRKIADDITFGLMERTEYLDSSKTDYTIEDGRAVVIESKSSDK